MKIFYVFVFLFNFSHILAQDFTKEFQKFLKDHSFAPYEYNYEYDRNDKKVTVRYFLGTPDKDQSETTVTIDSIVAILLVKYLDEAYEIENSKNVKEIKPFDGRYIKISYRGDRCDADLLVPNNTTAEFYETYKKNKGRHFCMLTFEWWEFEK